MTSFVDPLTLSLNLDSTPADHDTCPNCESDAMVGRTFSLDEGLSGLPVDIPAADGQCRVRMCRVCGEARLSSRVKGASHEEIPDDRTYVYEICDFLGGRPPGQPEGGLALPILTRYAPTPTVTDIVGMEDLEDLDWSHRAIHISPMGHGRAQPLTETVFERLLEARRSDRRKIAVN